LITTAERHHLDAGAAAAKFPQADASTQAGVGEPLQG
jgi:hypothetical protein